MSKKTELLEDIVAVEVKAVINKFVKLNPGLNLSIRAEVEHESTLDGDVMCLGANVWVDVRDEKKEKEL